GFKWAFIYTPNFVSTFQLRTYIPTGDSTRGLGTHHASIEPSLLVNVGLSERMRFEGQVGTWVPISGTDFAGSIMLYGAGVSYRVYDRPTMRISPVVETMGWTVLTGKETAALGGNVFQIRDAGGDTIVEMKLGIRTGFQNSDFYIGYGRPLTGDIWYKN